MNFKRFSKIYDGVVSARAGLVAVPRNTINVYAESDWFKQRRAILADLDTVASELEEWFTQHFPKNSVEAFLIQDFSLSEFIALLKKYPALSKNNRDALQNLLNDLKKCDFSLLGLDHVPDISEFP